MIAPAPPPPGRKALVVGINAYSSSPLHCCLNDATAVHEALQRMGFASTLVTDCDIKTFDRAKGVFVNSLQPGDIAFFYFAGHGAEASTLSAGKYSSSNWLYARQVPEERDDLPRLAVDAHNLLAEMEGRRTRFNALLLDCCRDDPLPTGNRSGSGGLASMDPKGSIVAFSCARGQTAAERRSARHGIFTQCLLEHIETPGLDINTLFIRVGNAVEKITQGKQVPYVNHSLRCEGASLFPAPNSSSTMRAQPRQVSAEDGGDGIGGPSARVSVSDREWGSSSCITPASAKPEELFGRSVGGGRNDDGAAEVEAARLGPAVQQLLADANLEAFSAGLARLGVRGVSDLQELEDDDLAQLSMQKVEVKRLRRKLDAGASSIQVTESLRRDPVNGFGLGLHRDENGHAVSSRNLLGTFS